MRAALGNKLQRFNSQYPNPTNQNQYQYQNGEDMNNVGWRSLASSIGSTVKRAAKDAYNGGYDAVTAKVATIRGPNAETWQQWRERRRQEAKGVEKLSLFPGFAVKRAKYGPSNQNEFSVDVYVDGYAWSLRPPEAATRTQKAFMRLARGFAALPKLPPIDGVGDSMVPDVSETSSMRAADDDSDVDSMLEQELAGHLPPRPDQMDDSIEDAVLHGDMRYLNINKADGDITPITDPSSCQRRHTPAPSITSMANLPHAELMRLHANLDSRLQPFWSSTLADRRVRISIFVASPRRDHDDLTLEPLATREVRTDPQGYFAHQFGISFEALCTHPAALNIVFGDQASEYTLIVKADLLPQDPPVAAQPQQPTPPGERPALLSSASVSSVRPPPPTPPPRPRSTSSTSVMTAASVNSVLDMNTSATASVPITSAKVRLISDIDDTVKNTEVLSTLKTIYRNVFVKDPDEVIVPGMAEWYCSMSQRGVRFHYVSNSPFELLPVLMDFFEVSGLPRGSVKLKYYGGRSILNGLWVGAGDKKRGGVMEILNHFPDSQFFLVGDSGEQDMELYAAVAAERPHQILGVFIRDVSSGDLDDPTPGMQVSYPTSPPPLVSSPSPMATPTSRVKPPVPQRMGSTSTNTGSSGTPPPLPSRPRAPSRKSTAASATTTYPPPPSSPFSDPPPQYFEEPLIDFSDTPSTSTRTYAPSNPMPVFRPVPGAYDRPPAGGHRSSSSASSLYNGRQNSTDAALTAQEKRRNEFLMRVEAARQLIPENIAFRVFKHPSECVEAARILDRSER